MKDTINDFRLYDLRVMDLPSPVGIDPNSPVFSWKAQSDQMGWLQSAYQIIVKQADAVVWDSGRVLAGESVGIRYTGEPLSSSTEYTWTLTVWDETGTSSSAASTFETGLCPVAPFGDAKWISYRASSLYDGTAYTIDFDFIIDRNSQGFCFGMRDSGSFLMWQVSTADDLGRVILRPHFKSGGSWTAYPGGPGNVQAIDVTDAIGCGEGSIIGKTIHERIEVDGKIIKTYFGIDADHLTLASTYLHTSDTPLFNIGIRHFCNARGACEIARYGNIVLRDPHGAILYQSDFSGEVSGFVGTKQAVTENGMLKVGSTSATGEFIAYPASSDSMPAFRKSITVKSGLVSAKLYTAGLGVYEAYVNGERIGRKYADGHVEYVELKPGFTEMADRKFYNTTNVTWMLTEGENILSAVVTNGWWKDQAAAHYGQNNAFLAKLILTYADGTTEVVDTDTTWKTALRSAVIFADIYTGETYDARVDQSWMKPGYSDTDWSTPMVNTEFKGTICPWMGAPILARSDLALKAKTIRIYKGTIGATEDAYGKINLLKTYTKDESFTLNPDETALIDFGQNFAGRESLIMQGERGTILTIEHGEMLNDQNGLYSRGNDGPEGSIYNANYRSAIAATTYTLSGEGEEHYHPAFSFYGFRYIEITATAPVLIRSVVGQPITSAVEDTGLLSTSDECVNQLISNIRWGMYSNYLSIPTDCPQRDERMGWTADTQVFTKAGAYLANSKSFMAKFLTDICDSQKEDGSLPGTAPTGNYRGGGWGGTGWADAGIIIPYTIYQHFGDKKVIEDNWDMMQRYVDGFLGSRGKIGPCNIWGDWLAYESNDAQIQSILAVCFYAWDALMMKTMALILGKKDEAEKYRALFEQEKAYFIEKYVNEQGEVIRGEQTICLYALYLDLLPDEASVETVKKQLISNIESKGNRLQTGFLGTAIILPTLTKIGRSDLAYTLLLQHDNPSWLYSVDQGATTIWERWNSYTKESGFGKVSMNSFNHYAYGAVAEWMYAAMAGIAVDPDAPGFKHFVLSPRPDTRKGSELPTGQKPITYVKAHYDSVVGRIESAWELCEGVFTYSFTIPTGTSARVEFPLLNGRDYVMINQQKFDFQQLSGTKVGEKLVFELGAGTYVMQ